MYRLLCLLVAACCIGHLAAQRCTTRYVGRVWFLLDVSETARTHSSSNYTTSSSMKYDILRGQIQQFAQGLTNARIPVDVQLGIVSYTGTARLTTDLTTPNSLVSMLYNQQLNGLIPDKVLTDNGQRTGGSWTFTGLEEANRRITPQPGYNNIIVIVSAQGSFNPTRRNSAVNAARALRSKGFQVYVIGIKELYNIATLDQNELKAVAGIVGSGSDPNVYNRLDNYNQLAYHLNSQIRDQRLCDRLTTAAPIFTTRPPRQTTSPRPVDPHHPCAKCSKPSGTYNVPHPDTCSKFYQCEGMDQATGEYVFNIFDCGPGTLFNDTDANCGRPSDFSCPAWQTCRNGRVERFPHLCCGKYWQCDNGLVTEMDCPNGQVYENGQCRSTANNKCLEQTPCPAGIFKNCNNFKPVPGKPCKFTQINPVTKMEYTGDCPYSTGWNQADCACSKTVTSCTVEEGVDVIDGSRDLQSGCKSYFHVSFDNDFRAKDDATNQPSDKYVNPNHVRLSNGYAVFSGMEGKTDDVIFFPWFANREFPVRFAMKLQFRFHDDARETEYVLLSNDRCTDCIATLRVTATRSSPTSNQWTVTFWVRDVNRQEASISARFNVNNKEGWNEVEVKVNNKEISGTVTTSMAGPVTLTGNNSITGKVGTTRCGLSIGQGRIGPDTSAQTVALDGDVNDFKFYECKNLDLLI